MKNPIVVLNSSDFKGYQLINCGYDNFFVQYEISVKQISNIKLGLLVTKSKSREEATAFLDNWSESTNNPTFEIWWPLNNSSGGFIANDFNMSQLESIKLLPGLIEALGLTSLYSAVDLN